MKSVVRNVLQIWVIVLAASFVVLATNAYAQGTSIIGQAKSEGLIGEKADGYIGHRVSDVSDDVRREVSRVNLQRRAKYTEFA